MLLLQIIVIYSPLYRLARSQTQEVRLRAKSMVYLLTLGHARYAYLHGTDKSNKKLMAVT
jgi:hypothetical protein